MPILGGGRRRLQQGRPSAGRPSAGRPSNAQRGPVDLPKIRPPACPLDDEALRDLQILSQNRDMSKLESQIQSSLEKISSASYAVGLEVQQLRDVANNMSEKKVHDKQEVQATLGELEKTMRELSERSERGVREIIDLKAELADTKDCMREVATRADGLSRHRRAEVERIQEALERAERENGEGGSTAGILDENVESMLNVLQQIKERKAAEYEQYSVPQKYARNNDYIAWKRQWHEGLHGEEVILQDSKTWFTRDGKPVFNFGAKEEAAKEAEDEDLVMEREVVSMRCPVSLAEMTEPYTARICNHTFQKKVIIDYIGARQSIQCPVPACDKMIGRNDFFDDRALLRKFERQRREQESDMDRSRANTVHLDTQSEDEEEEDEEMEE